jgi:hypothetical protein
MTSPIKIRWATLACHIERVPKIEALQKTPLFSSLEPFLLIVILCPDLSFLICAKLFGFPLIYF